ncbi:hypothetical protein [Vibrio sp. MA64]|uniref:hypothetical protein n=1 Tax=Vibrio sp. MA64 TaxID=2896365 RepID=UPI001E439667|nr:hypothetical protein [Vibrio sp. MA64]MCC9651533.1 hypothetical protein [Vibrio sp. MA64]
MELKLMLVDSTWPINTRSSRFRISLEKVFSCYICAWNRSNEKAQLHSDSELILNTKVGYGNPFRKAMALPMFFLHIIKSLNSLKPDVILASHWDSLLLCRLAIFFSKHEPKLIYDCLDLPTASNKFLRLFIGWIDKKNALNCDLTILASRYFSEFYSHNNVCIFENYPSQKLTENLGNPPDWYDNSIFRNGSHKILSWIGVVRYYEVMSKILDFIQEQSLDYKFAIFGDGPALNQLKADVKKRKLEDRVFFFGRYAPADLTYIYEVTDLVWAAYPTRDFNAKYAISNKYFECSMFSKYIVVSQDTMMAKKNDSPSIIKIDEYSIEDISIKLNSFDNSGNYHAYEPFVTWEDKEHIIIEEIYKIVKPSDVSGNVL